jgi:RimJ/RimL family protein N-acetyltransferase
MPVIIWGEKIGLRRLEDRLNESELLRMYEWANDEELLRWSGGSRYRLGFEEFRQNFESEQRWGPINRRSFLILRRDTRELIGRVGLFSIDWDRKQGELGVIIGEKQLWGQGYGRDAIVTFLRHIFRTSSIDRVFLFTFDDNTRAQHSFAACGFRVVRATRRFLPDQGEFDGYEMEITRSEFSDNERAKTNQRRHV